MKDVLYVLRAGLAGGLCLAMLTACQDGRGGFKARRYTLDEICTWQKANNKASSCDRGEANTNNTTIVTPTAPPEVVANNPPADPFVETPKSEPRAPESIFQPITKKASGDTNPGHAQGQTIEEREQTSIPPEEAQQVAAARDKFLAETERLITQKDPIVSALIKGIDISVQVDRVQRAIFLELDAMATVSGDLQMVRVKPTHVKYAADGSVRVLDFELRKDLNGPVVPKGNSLYIAATCAVEICSDIRVLMEFNVNGALVSAAFKLVHTGEGKFKLQQSNLTEITSFQKALESLAQGKKEDSTEKAPAVVEVPKKKKAIELGPLTVNKSAPEAEAPAPVAPVAEPATPAPAPAPKPAAEVAMPAPAPKVSSVPPVIQSRIEAARRRRAAETASTTGDAPKKAIEVGYPYKKIAPVAAPTPAPAPESPAPTKVKAEAMDTVAAQKFQEKSAREKRLQTLETYKNLRAVEGKSLNDFLNSK